MRWFFLCASLLVAHSVTAGELPDFGRVKIDGVIHSAVGVTRRDTPIDLFVSAEELRGHHDKTRIILVGGIDGDRRSVDGAVEALRWFYTHPDAAKYRKHVTLEVIPCGNPDGLLLDKGAENGQGGRPQSPPGREKRYLSQTNVESQYLQAWFDQQGAMAMYFLRVHRNETSPALQLTLVDGKGSVPLVKALDRWLDLAASGTLINKEVLQNRIARDDRAFVRRQLENYNHAPKSKNYFDTLPLKASARIATLGIEVAPPAFEWGRALPKSGSELAGLLYLTELPSSAASKETVDLLRAAADLALDKEGKPIAEPPFYSEMSDAVFMNGPLLAGVGKLTGAQKYFDACSAQQAVVRKHCKRDDGLYRHSPLCEAAWGRGNGFVALGNALMLEDWPANHPAHETLLAEFRQHMAALKQHQDFTGTWHQVIDHPESYREFTCTCMIGFAMARGVRAGWLDKKEYQPAIDKTWSAVKARTSDKGEFADVCTGTGKQKTLRDYFDREATQGRDGRGASMMLMFASEMLRSNLSQR